MGGGRRDRVREPAPRSLRVRAAGLLPGADAVSIERPARLTLRDRNVRVGAIGTRARAPVGATEPLAQEPGAVGGSGRGLELPRGRPDGGEAAEKWIRARVVAREHRPGLRHRARASGMCGGGRRWRRALMRLGRFHHQTRADSSLFLFFWPAEISGRKPSVVHNPTPPDAASSRQLRGRGRGSPGPRPGEPRARRLAFRRRSHGGASPAPAENP